MAAAALPSHGYLRDRHGHQGMLFEVPLLRAQRNFNPNLARSRRRKRSPVAERFPRKNLVMGEVKILKRGETLTAATKKAAERDGGGSRGKKLMRGPKGEADLALGSTERLGPEPEMVQKQLRIGKLNVADGSYAGSAFVVSPPPSSLPVPGFLGRGLRS